MEFQDIFAEYFSQYRGQAVQIPVFGDREFTVGIYRCNSAIRKWDRTDGMLWRELITTAGEQNTTIFPVVAKTMVGGTLTYPAPTNMRKPPATVRFYTSASNYSDVDTIEPEDAKNATDLDGAVWFSGGANTGYTMHVGSRLASQFNAWLVDYVYVKKPTLLTIATDPSDTVIDMSDPNYAIQDMLATAFAASKNGFGYKVAAKEKSIAIINMKIEDSSGTYGKTHGMTLDSGWGVNKPIGDIKL